jgi:hypothetical protein
MATGSGCSADARIAADALLRTVGEQSGGLPGSRAGGRRTCISPRAPMGKTSN